MKIALAHRFQDLLIGGVEVALRLLPEPIATLLGGGLGRFAGGVLRIRRRVVVENLRRAFPDRDAAWIRRTASASYAHLGREGIALLRMGAMGRDEILARTEMHGIEHVWEPLARGQGVVLLAGHIGNWEIGGTAMAVRDVPIDVVVKRQNNPLFHARVTRSRERFGTRTVDRVGSTVPLLRGLRGGRVVTLVADQNVRRGGAFVPFFGTPASTARGPALLAARSGAAVVFAMAIRLPGLRARYRVVCTPLDPGTDDASTASGESSDRTSDSSTEAFLARYLGVLEEEIRSRPEQYFWAHRRWKTRPASEES